MTYDGSALSVLCRLAAFVRLLLGSLRRRGGFSTTVGAVSCLIVACTLLAVLLLCCWGSLVSVSTGSAGGWDFGTRERETLRDEKRKRQRKVSKEKLCFLGGGSSGCPFGISVGGV